MDKTSDHTNHEVYSKSKNSPRLKQLRPTIYTAYSAHNIQRAGEDDFLRTENDTLRLAVYRRTEGCRRGQRMVQQTG
jgi:hypothetical protein